MIISPQKSYKLLVENLSGLQSFEEVITYWTNNIDIMKECDLVFTFDEIGAKLPLQSAVKAFDNEKIYLRSVYDNHSIYIFNIENFQCLRNEIEYKFGIEHVLLVDTQFGKHAYLYYKDTDYRNTDEGLKTGKVIRLIAENNVNFNFIFYVIENYPNYLAGDMSSIKSQVVALKAIQHVDKTEFINNGKFISLITNDELESQADDILLEYKKLSTGMSDGLRLQSEIACLILKTILLKHDKNLSINKRNNLLVTFADEVLSRILQRELVICIKYLSGENISLFDPVNSLAAADIPKKINAMSWDFMLLRLAEEFSLSFSSSIFKIAYFLSFDRRLVEIRDAYSIKGCLRSRNLNKGYTIADSTMTKIFESHLSPEVHSNIFSIDRHEMRSKNMPSLTDVFTLRRQLEYKVIKAAKVLTK